jgi:UDP-2-acetamido-2,6-beta-L-arabino-hexul-4-ose reductase
MNILVTGTNGFIGRNLIAWLGRLPEVRVLEFDQENTLDDLGALLAQADIVYHLAGVNRPQSEEEFRTGNVDLTAQLCNRLLALGQATPVVLSSSIQAELDNPYGVSKRQAEDVVAHYATASGARCTIFRLKKVFGKWCRPNYNSVVATFCHNIAHDQPITISDPARELELVYVDDVVEAFIAEIRNQGAGVGTPIGREAGVSYKAVAPSYRVTLGQLAQLIRSFRESRRTLQVPDFGDAFTGKLYGTFLSYLEPGDFAYDLTKRTDPRGFLAEFVKSDPLGQIFVSRTKPGITRGNHYHHTKTEKFLVVEGEAIIRFRHIRGEDVIEYRVRGEDFRVVDIPTGYTHSIENVGAGELVTLFWASEIFDPAQPDTIYEEV